MDKYELMTDILKEALKDMIEARHPRSKDEYEFTKELVTKLLKDIPGFKIIEESEETKIVAEIMEEGYPNVRYELTLTQPVDYISCTFDIKKEM